LNSIFGNNTEGLTSTPMQQGGVGLLLSILVVSVPPMAAMFFQGTLGSALTHSVFTPTGGRPGRQGQPPGSYAGRGQQYSLADDNQGKTQSNAFSPALQQGRVTSPSVNNTDDEIRLGRRN
jgi:type IV secretion system protein VirB6